MTTWFVSYEDGTDANAGVGAGDSFATRRKKLDNVVAAALAPGDTIKVMGSPAASSLGINGTWTDGPLPATKNIESSTNATPISVKITGHGFATGKTLQIVSHTVNTKANGTWEITVTDADNFTLDGSVGNGVGGATGTARDVTNRRVKLAAAVTKAIALIADGQGLKTNWTSDGGANVTPSVTTADFKQGAECQQIVVAAGFATGLAAHFATGTIDLSPYKQVTFWIKQTAGTLIAAADLSLKLCSDVAGAVAVNTINVPAIAALNQWVPFTVDTGGALGAAIKSVGFYVNTDSGAQTFLLDAITASKDSTSADALSLTSLIGKNTAGETWWGIQSISGTRVSLDQGVNASVNASANAVRGYSGTTETVTTYKKETIKTAQQAAASGNAQSVQDSGVAGNVVTISGGWNRVDMTTQTLDSWFDGQNGLGTGINLNGQSFLALDLISTVRYFNGHGDSTTSANNCSFGTTHSNNNSSLGYALNNVNITDLSFTTTFACANSSQGYGFSASPRTDFGTLVAHGNGAGGGVASGPASKSTTMTANNNSGAGVPASGNGSSHNTVTANGNVGNGITKSAGSRIKTATTNGNGATGCAGNTNAVVENLTSNNNLTGIGSANAFSVLGGSTSGNTSPPTISGGGLWMYLRNFTINEASEVGGFNAFADARVFSENHDNTPGNNIIFTDGGQIASQTALRHTASGYAWKASPTSAIRAVSYPLWVSLLQVACPANEQRTVKVWVQTDNAGITARLVAKGGQLAGVPNDVVATATGASVGAWEQISVTFTPTEAGVIELRAEAYGGTTFNAYFDDLEVT